MRNVIALAIVMASSFGLLFAKPMEALSRYNVVLVHGAADRWQGLDCDYADTIYSEAYGYKEDIVLDSSTCAKDARGTNELKCSISYSLPSRIGGIKKPNGEEGSSATGMVKELAPLLRDTILETPSSVYLQRPFTHPAGSPADNGDEIGKSSWAGVNKCSARRSLIEEAQQFKAEGADTLKRYRESPVAKYRSIPSRNILIGHSMGGVAIRESFQVGYRSAIHPKQSWIM